MTEVVESGQKKLGGVNGNESPSITCKQGLSLIFFFTQCKECLQNKGGEDTLDWANYM